METKQARGFAKGAVTKKIKEITALMSNESNVDEVNKKAAELQETFKKFKVTHDAFHFQLKDKESIEESEIYFELVSDQLEQLQENISLWLAGIDSAKQLTVNPEDSISRVGSHVSLCHAPHAIHLRAPEQRLRRKRLFLKQKLRRLKGYIQSKKKK